MGRENGPKNKGGFRGETPDYVRLRKGGFMNRFIYFCLFAFCLVYAQNNYVFGPSIRVNDDPPGTRFHATTQRCVAARGDTVYLVWRDDRYQVGTDNNAKIFFSKSTNAGNTWSANLMISQNWDSVDFFLPHMALDGSGNIYVAYCSKSDNDNDRDIYFTKSTNGGFSFTPPIMVNDSAVVQGQTFCACAVDSTGQNVYVVWEDSRNGNDEDIYLGRSTDGGITFLPSIRVNDGFDTKDQWIPVVACDESGENVYVAWMDFRDTLYGAGVYFSRSTDYGQTFGVNYRVNDTISTAGWPSIYYHNNLIYCAWRDSREEHYIYFAKSSDGGISFGSNVGVRDYAPGAGMYPSITADDSGKIYVVWEDSRTFSSTGFDIYFSFSSDSGITFQPNVRVNDLLGNVSAWDGYPAVAVNQNGQVFVAWESDRNDPAHANFDIYFASGEYVAIQEAVVNKIDMKYLSIEPVIFSSSVKINTRVLPLDRSQCGISIYDATGRLVKQFKRLAMKVPGIVIWDGRDDVGGVVPPGVYFVILGANNKIIQSGKAVKIR